MYASLLARQVELYQRPPGEVAADGGFARWENLATAPRLGVKDAMISNKRGLRPLDMMKSLGIYQKLRNFRAGIEAAVSRAKRRFGLDRCTCTGWLGFQQYVWSAVLENNVLAKGRLLAQLRGV